MAEVGVRRARTADVTIIKQLVDGYAGRVLLAKEIVTLYESVQEFLVAEVDGEVVGCGALHVLWADLGEIRTVAVHPRALGRGVGHAIVAGLIENARALGLARLFVLTFEKHFFGRHGFVEIDGTPVEPDVFAAMLRSYDAGVAEFLDLAHVKPNTLGNTRMLLRIEAEDQRVLCPDLIGRAAEVALLRGRIDAMAAGRGGVVGLVAEAGAGKTRLAAAAAEAAAARGCPVLTGRAVPGPNPVPYRALVEAFLGAFRSAPVPDSSELAGLGAHLGRLVPAWRRDATAEDSPLLLAEAVVRLLRAHGGGRGCVLVVEDLHWADPETLAALEYLGDALPSEPVLCLTTSRPGGGAAELLERLERRDPAAVVRLGQLGEDDVERMVAACLATPTPPAGLAGFVRAHGDGTPFLVEELLAGLVAAGTLRREDGAWVVGGELTPTVPASLRESIARRMGLLDPSARGVVGAAAMLGRRFDWELLPGIADVDARGVVEGLRAAVDAQLVAVDGDGFVFRHSLTREAVLGELLPPERRRLARLAWPVVERAHPGLPGATCELAAELAEAAGAPSAAAERLVESARRALAAGALVTAEGTARRARRLAPPDEPVADAAGEALVRVLVAAGKPVEARELGLALLPRLGPAERADLLVGLARAALSAGDVAAADRDVAAARELVAGVDSTTDATTEHDADPAPHADPADGTGGMGTADAGHPAVDVTRARLDAVAAAVAMDQVRLDDAVRLGHAALAAAERADAPEVQCEALEVLGRAERGRGGVGVGRGFFERAAVTAERHGMTALQLRARHELAILDWADGGVQQMRATRDLAARHGALITVAVMDLSLADIALMAFDRPGCLAAAGACAEASRRFGLATEPVANLWLAGAHALAGDDAGMAAATAKALAHDPGDPRILGDLHGRVLVTRSIVAGDLEALPGHLETMMEHVRAAPPTTSVFPGRVLWATLHAIDDDDLGVAQRAENAATVARMGMAQFGLACAAIDAVVLGRTGDRAAATALMADVRARMRKLRHSYAPMHVQELLIARAALRDGWGDPVTWLREAEAFFAAGGYDRAARRCRTMLGAAGAPMPRRGRGESAVPTALRGLGVTSREVDVLKLVATGLSNREIGERLYLATKTVERHVGSLLARTGAADRSALAELARVHGVQTG